MAAFDPDMEYLAPDFDPASLTVPKLRNILMSHDISYPSSAKKSDLIQLFNTQLVPQAKKILNSRARTKRSTKGIVDVPSSQESTADPSEEELPSEPPSRTRGSRRTTRARTEENEPPPSRASARHTRSSEPPAEIPAPTRRTRKSTVEPVVEEEPPPTTARRGRKSAAAPALKKEDSEPAAWHVQSDDSPFTADNPFQSGSSPLEPAAQSKERRRTTVGPTEKKKRKSEPNRRKTEQYKTEDQDETLVPTSSHTFEVPVSALDQEQSDGTEPGEEFTAEEQLELEREQVKTGQTDVLPPRRRRQPRSSSNPLKAAPLALVTAMLVGFGAVWRQEKIELGYCGVGRDIPSSSIGGVEIPEWASTLQPQCEPCPQHAYCLENFQAECEADFVLTPHPLSLGGLIPLPPTCEPDGTKALRVKAMASLAVNELRERNAKFECGELMDEEGKPAKNAEITEESLKEDLKQAVTRRRKAMSDVEFDDIWRGAIGEIMNREEIQSRDDGHSGSRVLRSTSLARVSLACTIRRSVRESLARHVWKLVGLLLVVVASAYTRFSIVSSRETEARAKQLASLALNRLATQAALNAQDPRAFPETWISMGHLRDDILRDDFSAARRNKLWARVQAKVEQNSNVRPMVRESRSGDVSRVWEWVGAINAIDDGGPSRRGSSRFSLGPVTGSPGRFSPAVKSEDTSEMRELHRSWDDDSRPIY